jgi:hypothetical protein
MLVQSIRTIKSRLLIKGTQNDIRKQGQGTEKDMDFYLKKIAEIDKEIGQLLSSHEYSVGFRYLDGDGNFDQNASLDVRHKWLLAKDKLTMLQNDKELWMKVLTAAPPPTQEPFVAPVPYSLTAALKSEQGFLNGLAELFYCRYDFETTFDGMPTFEDVLRAVNFRSLARSRRRKTPCQVHRALKESIIHGVYVPWRRLGIPVQVDAPRPRLFSRKSRSRKL